MTALAYADDIRLTDGTVFKDAKIVGHGATSVTINFAAGVAMVNANEVSPALVQAFDAKRDIDEAVPTDQAPQPATASTTSQQVDQGPPVDPKVKAAVDKGPLHARGNVIQVIPGRGVVASLMLSYYHTVTVPHSKADTDNPEPSGLGHNPLLESTTETWTTTESKLESYSVGNAFVECKPDNFTQGQIWVGDVWAEGTDAYTNDDGQQQTVPKFTARAKAAYRYYSDNPDRLATLPTDETPAPIPTVTSPVTATTSLDPLNSK